MSPIDLAKTYMDSFYGEKPLDEMRGLLAEDMEFSGPFYKYQTADDYIESLQENLIGFGNYELLKEIEKENSCCLVYKFQKPGEKEEVMAQLFEIADNKIRRIRLVLNAERLLDQ